MHRAWQVMTPVVLFVAAFAVRILPWTGVFQGDRVVPIDGDAYYHLRRIRYTLDHFPDVLRFDPWMNFPEGAQPIWSPAFDWLTAALLRPLPGIDAPETLETYAVLVPPLIGALTVVLVYFVGRRFFSPAVAIIAAMLLSVLPGHSIYSQVGALDHHVAVAFCATILLASMMMLFRRTGLAGDARTGSHDSVGLQPWLLSAFVGLSLAGIVLVWPGALLHVGVIQLAMIARVLTASDRSRGIFWAQCFALAHGVATIAVFPFSAGNEWTLWGSMNPVVLSNFQPIYFAVAACCFGLLSVLWKVDRLGVEIGTRVISAVAVGAIALAGLFGAIPELAGGATDALSWLSKEDEFQALVSESQPLFSGPNGVKRARGFLGDFVFLVPVLVPLLAWRARTRPDQLLLIGWGAAFWLISLLQWRFVNTYSIAQCLLVAVALTSLFEWIGRRLDNRRAAYFALGAAAGLTLFASLPALRFHAEYFGHAITKLRGQSPPLTSGAIRARYFEVAADFLRENTPSPESSPYSVLAPWSYGHLLKYMAERPVVQDNFGNDVAPENFSRADDYFLATDEVRALERIAPTKARYVVVNLLGSGQSRDYAHDSLFKRLRELQGTAGRIAKSRSERSSVVEALSRHRLVYQSMPLQKGTSTPFIMIFEIVPGALLVGNAEPGTTVRAQLAVLPALGDRFDYRSSVETDANGEYRLRLPYSNERSSPNVGIGARYSIRVGRDSKKIAIAETAVLRGERVRGPSFAE